MNISEDRQSHLAHLVIDKIWQDDLVDYDDDDKAMRAGKQGMAKFVKELADLDRVAREKVASLKRGVVEGSPEWDVMYQKYFEEELQRRGN
ncbi:MAG: hypothetical protein CL677_08970 [Bdellovibrionaceae bacterium]|nr:hypothetical protein [Pseudobdellovibrionaceae bacterium]|tara:strand:- start:712 stop:984 length:273 start_codon:yes stop_codon:yes gene_type:complete